MLGVSLLRLVVFVKNDIRQSLFSSTGNGVSCPGARLATRHPASLGVIGGQGEIPRSPALHRRRFCAVHVSLGMTPQRGSEHLHPPHALSAATRRRRAWRGAV